MKRLKEADHVDDPNYRKYHQFISHPLEKYFVLKDKIMQLDEEEKIEFEEVASSNMTSTTMVSQSNKLDKTLNFTIFYLITWVPGRSKTIDFQAIRQSPICKISKWSWLDSSHMSKKPIK
ncbi:hypothetical protein PVK06_011898 [Gossypium arboreum]|uniref:Uncharacterized protein n=1 Tax=Gossypium arboreum TaxID=29729 RepID=A0ABR0QA33_GOSAR|nr:hypothetical protein PVK06_011898 [Gossypium arboreum]